MQETLIRQLASVRAAAQPALASRCDKAVALVLTGKVHVVDATQAVVDSYREPGVQYAVNGTCACQDAKYGALEGWCAHKIAVDLVRASSGVTGGPPATVAPACPEAAFSITLKGTMGGHDAMLTARGSTWEAFAANVARLKGLLDAVAPATSREPGEDEEDEGLRTPTCSRHGIVMKPSKHAAGTFYCPKRETDGSYCGEQSPHTTKRHTGPGR